MKFATFAIVLALATTTAFADHKKGHKKGHHNKNHQHVSKDKADHKHDGSHHMDRTPAPAADAAATQPTK